MPASSRHLSLELESQSVRLFVEKQLYYPVPSGLEALLQKLKSISLMFFCRAFS